VRVWLTFNRITTQAAPNTSRQVSQTNAHEVANIANKSAYATVAPGIKGSPSTFQPAAKFRVPFGVCGEGTGLSDHWQSQGSHWRVDEDSCSGKFEDLRAMGGTAVGVWHSEQHFNGKIRSSILRSW
jgi:hypothetical protein